MPLVTPYRSCRICASPFDVILDLGTPVLSAFVKPEDPDPPRAPLVLVRCQKCGLVQLQHAVDPDRLFTDAYWYRSGINETMVAELADLARDAVNRVGLYRNSVVLDIGCNDGTLLAQFPACVKIGVDPNTDMAERTWASGAKILPGFFPDIGDRITSKSVSIATSIAMFYDVNDPLAFVREIDRILTDDGIWVVQFQDLASMVRAHAFDNICFEHVCYYSLQTFWNLLADTDLKVIDVQKRAINGGSIRIIVGRCSTRPNVSLGSALVAEEPWVGHDQLDRFAWQVRETCAQLKGTLERCGGNVDLYAASTKSSTLLQTAGIDNGLIEVAVERTPEKVGLVTSGTRIPIISEAQWRENPAPVTLIGAYQFRDAFFKREAAYLARGGQFIVPLPHLEIVRG